MLELVRSHRSDGHALEATPTPDLDGERDGGAFNDVSDCTLEQPRTHLSSLAPKDPGAMVATRASRLAVFVILCQSVQMFMSYDGGAVPASLDTLQEKFDGSWSEFEFGVLGAMDKLGMVVASVPWGWALQRCPAKLLLIVSLFLNAVVTFTFGWLPSKETMLVAKFAMGATQSLQGVWGTVWTMNMAPPDRLTMWLGLGAVSAGIGNGIGTSVAGFGTANGLPFAFAFELAGAILGFLWVVQLFFPSRWLATTIPPGAGGSNNGGDDHVAIMDSGPTEINAAQADSSARKDESSMILQLRALLGNRVFVGATLAISLCMFQVSGLQFLWTRAFTELWMVAPNQPLSKNWVTAMFIVVTGGGGGLGIAVGPWLIDRKGGFNQLPGVLRTLRILWFYQLLAAAAGVVGAAGLYGKNHPWSYSGEWGDHWLWLSWLCIFVIYGAHNASVAALCGISLQAVPEEMRTFASGTELTVRNVLGYIGGPLLPSIVMTLNSGWTTSSSWQLSLGLGFVFLLNLLGIAILAWSRIAARLELSHKRAEALHALREAMQSEDVAQLERAIASARHVELEKWKHGDGEAIMGMANELVGRCLERERHGYGGASTEAGASVDLQLRAQHLQQEVERQQRELDLCREETRELRALLARAVNVVEFHV